MASDGARSEWEESAVISLQTDTQRQFLLTMYTHTHKTVNATHFFPQWRVAVHAAAWLKVCTYVLIHKLKQYATYSTWKTGDRKGTKINSENIIAVN